MLAQVQLLNQAVEDVFSSPAVMLQAFRAVGPPLPAENGSAEHFAGTAPDAPPVPNRGGDASSSGHGLDLPFVNALYTALLKVGRQPGAVGMGNILLRRCPACPCT